MSYERVHEAAEERLAANCEREQRREPTEAAIWQARERNRLAARDRRAAMTAQEKMRETMSAALTTQIDHVLIEGDLSRLSPEDKTRYYLKVCESVGLNPLTKPFAYIRLQSGKEILYATKDAAEQLRYRESLTLHVIAREVMDGVYVVTARARTKDGREDESTGAVWIQDVKGEPRANAMMKAETKAKRRVTLSICGLSMPDESDVDSIPGAIRVQHDAHTGEVIEPPALPPKPDAGPGLAVAAQGERARDQLCKELRLSLEHAVNRGELNAACRACKSAESKGRISFEQAADLREIAGKQRQQIEELEAASKRTAEEAPAPPPAADEDIPF